MAVNANADIAGGYQAYGTRQNGSVSIIFGKKIIAAANQFAQLFLKLPTIHDRLELRARQLCSTVIATE